MRRAVDRSDWLEWYPYLFRDLPLDRLSQRLFPRSCTYTEVQRYSMNHETFWWTWNVYKKNPYSSIYILKVRNWITISFYKLKVIPILKAKKKIQTYSVIFYAFLLWFFFCKSGYNACSRIYIVGMGMMS